MRLAHHDIEMVSPGTITLAEGGIHEAVGMGGLVLHPQQHQGHAFAPQFAMNIGEVRQRSWATGRVGA